MVLLVMERKKKDANKSTRNNNDPEQNSNRTKHPMCYSCEPGMKANARNSGKGQLMQVKVIQKLALQIKQARVLCFAGGPLRTAFCLSVFSSPPAY